jgi:sulfhydrogenase subunit beta (sulfur reductase)
MSEFLVPKGAALNWIHSLARNSKVYFPQKIGNSNYRFDPVREKSELQFEEYRPTVVPPGKKMSPAREELFRFENKEGGPAITASFDKGFQVLAGVRPCDLKAIHLMDLAYGQGTCDPNYQTRRMNTAIIGFDCLKPCDENCFCASTGSLSFRKSADIFLTPVGNEFLVEALTPLGEKLVAEGKFNPTKDAAVLKTKAEASRSKPFGRQLAAQPKELPKVLNAQWKSKVWDKHVERCFSCGSCNMVCPTCYCFEVRDDLNVENPATGARTRFWDACMLPHFASVAGGHNFRPQPAARQRHRIKRKFEYLTDKFGEGSFCVGCGRCGRQCTSGIDIFNIVNDIVSDAGVSS